MSKLQELINEYCPDGVEYRTVGEVCNKITDYTAAGSFADVAKNVKYSHDSSEYAQLIRTVDLKAQFTNNGSFVYVNEHAFNYLWRVNLNCECLVMPNVGNCGEVYYVTPDIFPKEKNVLGPNAILVRSDSVNNRYLYYIFSSAEFQNNLSKIISTTGQTKYNKTNFKQLTIPIPPLAVQSEIVRILDHFTLLTAELTDELALRKEQFEEILHRLINGNSDKTQYKLSEICHIEKGKTAIQKAESGEFPLVVTTTERKTCSNYQFDGEAVCIPLVSSRGHGVASLNHVYYQSGKFALGNILCAVLPNDKNMMNVKYLYYYFECTKDYLLVPLMKGGANVSMHIPDIERVNVSLPSIAEQNKRVYILENLQEYYLNLLPAEITSRKKQYEYYRDKLLTFKARA